MNTTTGEMIQSSGEIILGSAFCPPTIGHQAIVNALLEIPGIHTVRLVPSGPRYDKVYAFQKNVRRRLVEIFAQEFEDPRVVADFTFFDSLKQTTTLGMDEYYKRKNGVSPIQVFGADVVTTMATWPNTPEDRDYLLNKLPKIFLSRKWVELNLEWRWNYTVLETEIPEASSTAVREQGRIDLLTSRVRDAYNTLVLETI